MKPSEFKEKLEGLEKVIGDARYEFYENLGTTNIVQESIKLNKAIADAIRRHFHEDKPNETVK